MSAKLSARNRDAEVLQALQQFYQQHGRMPTIKEICFAIKITRGQLYRNISRLVRAGHLVSLPRGAMQYQFSHSYNVARAA